MEAYLKKSFLYATILTNLLFRLHRLILLVDMKVGLMDSDKMLIEMLTETHRPFMIVLTKADKLKEK